MNVKEMLALGETETIEFKVDLSTKPETFLKTVVAFANGNGGTLVFGIDDKTHAIVGFDSLRHIKSKTVLPMPSSTAVILKLRLVSPRKSSIPSG